MFTPCYVAEATTFAFSAVLSLLVRLRGLSTLNAAHMGRNTRLSPPAQLQCLCPGAGRV